MDAAQFRNPPSEYRPVAMWFLNARIDDQEVKRQVAAMASGGIGAIQAAARTGLQTPYLSHEWFRLIGLILDEARQHGLEVWLADEYPYPSGASGGEVVLRHPEYRAWQMRASRVLSEPREQIQAAAPGTILLRACAVPIDNGRADWARVQALESFVGWVQYEHILHQPTSAYLTDRRYMSNAPRPTLIWSAPDSAERWEVWLIAAQEITNYKFFGSYVDLCNPEACVYFLRTTHERYLDALGPSKFAQLAGFFMDEAHPQNWSWCLPEFFRKTRGYDLLDALCALWTDVGPQTATVRYDYRQSITELFVESFHKPVAEWCQAHGVALSLEVPSTRSIVQRFADVPGIDPGHDKVGVPLDEILARELSSFRGSLGFPASLAAQSGRQRVLDELFHSVGWSLTLQDMKAMLDRAAARGGNLFAFHAFCYTIGGLRKWDAPPSEFDQNPYWPHFPLLSRYAGRLGYALSRGRRVAPVALVDPITSVWAHEDAADAKDDIAREIIDHWTSLMRELIAVQRPFDNLDPLMLAEARVYNGRLLIGDAEYRVVALPSMTTLEGAAWTRLEQFVADGGTVIATGSLPSEEIEVGSDVAGRCKRAFEQESATGFVRVDSVTAVLELLDRLTPPDLTLISGGARRNLLLAQRRDGDLDIFFIANSSMDEQSCDVVVRGEAGRTVARVDLETGQSITVATTPGPFQLEFPRHGAQLLVVGTTASGAPRQQLPEVELDLGGEWRCELVADSLNALRFDGFRFGPTLIKPKPLINVFQDLVNAGEAWPGQMEVTPIFGAPPRVGLKLPLTATYAADFEVRDVPQKALLCIEDAAFQGEWELSLNGERVPPSAFQRRRRWSNDNREGDVSALLVKGPNVLVAKVLATHPWDGLVDAIYLLGDFGVELNVSGGVTLTERPQTLRWTERHTQGYPYFSGTMRLSRNIPLDKGPFRLRLPDQEMMFAGVAQLAIDGRDLGVRAWAPYVWDMPDTTTTSRHVTLTLTNTLLEQLEGKRYDANARGVHPLRAL